MKHLSVLLALMSAVAYAGSGDKMTGSGSWINGLGENMYANFNAHEAAGKRTVKGSHYQEGEGGSFSADVDIADITVGAGRACYGGIVTEATGAWSWYLGKRVWVTVLDGGDAQDEVGSDTLQAGIFPADRTSPPAFCSLSYVGSNQPFYEGNIQLHAGTQ